MDSCEEKVYCPCLVEFERCKNLSNIGTGNYDPRSIQVYEFADEKSSRNIIKANQVPYEIKDDILFVDKDGHYLLRVDVEYRAKVVMNSSEDYYLG